MYLLNNVFSIEIGERERKRWKSEALAREKNENTLVCAPKAQERDTAQTGSNSAADFLKADRFRIADFQPLSVGRRRRSFPRGRGSR